MGMKEETELDRIMVEGVEYTPKSVDDIRENVLIPIRNQALEQNAFDYAVGLSHAIAFLADYKYLLEEYNYNV